MPSRSERSWAAVAAGAALALGTAAGCAAEPDAEAPASDVLLRDHLLVPIGRVLDETAAIRKQETLARLAASKLRGGASRDFYLAIRKSALDQRWFWSVYLKELQPYGPSPESLGTRVVRFREQNDKLYVFDADDRRATSDVFHPELIIDAFPIVEHEDFHGLPGSGGYLLFDPAAGLNRFGAVADWFATDPYPVSLATELSFVQGFKSASDGGHYEQIITAYADVPIGAPGDVEPNELRLAATLGVNLRRYTESPHYVPTPAPAVPHYFLSEPFQVPGTGDVARNAVHWAFHPGMAPIPWRISPELLEIQTRPELGGADLFAAMKRGIESWNAVYGFPVFAAQLASPSDSFADDHLNYLIVDPDDSKGYAYADWRTNPNTGEIRGASVYFGGGFFIPFPDDLAFAGSEARRARPKTKLPGLVWGDRGSEPLCVRWAPAWEERRALDPGTAPAGAELTGAEKLERYVQHVTAHEIGHTLGLRHNFKGSLYPPTSSVMEYNDDDAAFAQPTPGPYDHQAIAYLHGRTSARPSLPFCTDEATSYDPNCVRFDPGTATPLLDYQIPFWSDIKDLILLGLFPPDLTQLLVQIFGGELLAYTRAGTPAEAAASWAAALDGVRAPIDPVVLAGDPAYGPAANLLAQEIFRELLVAPTSYLQRTPSSASVVAAIAADARAIIENVDGVRTFATRRLVVDALERFQTIAALIELEGARATLAAQLPGLDPVRQALTRDLIARIDAALSPYFE